MSDRVANHMQCAEFCIAAVAEVDHMQIQCAEFCIAAVAVVDVVCTDFDGRFQLALFRCIC